MTASPIFITQYEVLRTSDYVLLTLSAPTGEVVDGKMQVAPIQQMAFTLGRFVEMAGLINDIARKIGSPDPQSAWGPGKRPRAGSGADAKEPEAEDKDPSDWVVRH